ncbi:hypothetical protein F66182_10246 [Fusarium sp. NRRL 66182]|nr:hypothetical protein F66182_10246 [Fusarium sp. NRRL 66182]
MDFFSRLPHLVRTKVFIRVESETNILRLIRASPSMLWHYVDNRQSIEKAILENILAVDTTGSILQDALTIYNFSTLDEGPSLSETRHLMQHWTAQDWPNPLAQRDTVLISQLYRLISRVIGFIEDYLSKSLDPFPPLAYAALPDRHEAGLLQLPDMFREG